MGMGEMGPLGTATRAATPEARKRAGIDAVQSGKDRV